MILFKMNAAAEICYKDVELYCVFRIFPHSKIGRIVDWWQVLKVNTQVTSFLHIVVLALIIAVTGCELSNSSISSADDGNSDPNFESRSDFSSKVVLPDGTPATDAEVVLVRRSESNFFLNPGDILTDSLPITISNSAGVFRFENIADGNYLFYARWSDNTGKASIPITAGIFTAASPVLVHLLWVR